MKRTYDKVKNGIIELDIDRNCCSPRGRDTLTVKRQHRTPRAFTSVRPDVFRYLECTFSPYLCLFQKKETRGRETQKTAERVRLVTTRKIIRKARSKCQVSSRAYLRREKHVIPKKTYRGDSASVVPLYLSTFLRLSVSRPPSPSATTWERAS